MLEVDEKVRECAILLQDGKLIAKLSAGYLIAIDAKYHAKCLVSLYNRARKFKSSTSKSNQPQMPTTDLDELAFAELIAYIDYFLQCEDLAALKLSELATFYQIKQQELGIDHGNVNKTRLKERILEVFPDLTAHIEGRKLLFALKQDIGGVLRAASSEKDTDAYHLAKTPNIIRKDFLMVKNTFNGTFTENCQRESIPASLKTLLSMIMKDPTTEGDESQACMTVAQLILFNSVCRARNREPNSRTRHTRSRECPLPIYTALKIHGVTRDKSLVDIFYNLGMCISYDRLLTITTEITNAVIERYENEEVVCPTKLRRELFTTAAVDNIDHNPSSTGAHGSFHGTATSIAQHPTVDEMGLERPVNTIDPKRSSSSKSVSKLPSFYTDVQPVIGPRSNYFAPKTSRQQVYEESEKNETEVVCLKNISELLSKEELDKDDSVSWAAYRASTSVRPHYTPAIISLLPTFTENAHSLAMIEHSMKVIKESKS